MPQPPPSLEFLNSQLDDEIWECHVCTRMQARTRWSQGSPSWWCVLCARPCCKEHSGKEQNVCEINHLTYFRSHPQYEHVYRYLKQKENDLEEDKKKQELREKNKMGGASTAHKETLDAAREENNVDLS
ncbi:hypothetical protein N431DRAFT_533686 [Stipitochalara longipes BDJ]|nr:hypothetical protein N431DRAFT_533686 [Stipitochalara longipes BDJ]